MQHYSDKKKGALIIFILLSVILAYLLSPYIKAIFLGLIFYILSKPIYSYLRKKKINHILSFGIVTFMIFFIILIPLYIITISAVVQVDNVFSTFDANIDDFIISENLVDKVNSYFVMPNFSSNIQTIEKITTTAINYIKDFLIKTFSNIFTLILQLVIAFFILFYTLKSQDKFFQLIIKHSPFNKKNTQEIIQNFVNISNAGIIVSGISAAIQAILLTIVLMVFKTPGGLLLGLFAFILGFIPVVGTYLIWIPISIINLIGGNLVAGIVIFIAGVIISNIDILYRPLLQERFGKIHPLIGLIGTFMGLQFFGFIGIIIGPLILSYFFMIFRMLDEEFFSK